MSSDRIKLLAEPIDVGGAIADASADDAGGIAVFLGTTRAEQHADGRRLIALDYEAYADMADKQLRELADTARKRWPISRVAILHRIGRVAVGEPSVLIAVACPHRAEAFAACQWLIDTLKSDAAIWKKEVWDDGGHSWVDPQSPKAIKSATV